MAKMIKEIKNNEVNLKQQSDKIVDQIPEIDNQKLERDDILLEAQLKIDNQLNLHKKGSKFLYIWIVIIISIILIFGLIFYFFFRNDQPEHKLITGENLDKSIVSKQMTAIKLYKLNELAIELGVNQNQNWSKLLPEIGLLANYTIYSENTEIDHSLKDPYHTKWTVAFNELPKDKLLTLFNYSTPLPSNFYKLTLSGFGDYNAYQLKQLKDRINLLGYNAVDKYSPQNSVISIDSFTNLTNAQKAGEEIFFYYKQAGLFPANFKIDFINYISTSNPLNYYMINVLVADSLENAIIEFSKLKNIINDKFIYINQLAGSKYELNIGFLENNKQAINIFELLKNSYLQAVIIKHSF